MVDLFCYRFLHPDTFVLPEEIAPCWLKNEGARPHWLLFADPELYSDLQTIFRAAFNENCHMQ